MPLMRPIVSRGSSPRQHLVRALLAAGSFLLACAPLGPGPGDWVDDLAVAPQFPAFARAPVEMPAISSGRQGLPIMVFDPGVYADDEGYHLFYSTPFCRRRDLLAYTWDPASPASCNIVNALGSVAYAFSPDRGLTWEFRETPVVLPSGTGFDSAKIETPHVFRVGETLYLAYSADGDRAGEKFPSRYQIGLARLELGGRSVRDVLMDPAREFERSPRPLLPADPRPGRFDNNVQEPSIVVREGRIELFFIGLGLSLPEAQMDAPAQAIQSVALGRAELDLEMNLLSRSETPIMDAVNISEVKHFEGRYHLFASSLVSGEFHHGEEITYATSADGRNWTPQQVLLSPGERPGWDNWGLMAPTLVVESDRVVLFYTAYEAVPSPCFPVPRNGRFGRPVEGDAQCLFATLGRAISSRIAAP
jgi:predicted GH43/DUF377 family glycosyl hydrolase